MNNTVRVMIGVWKWAFIIPPICIEEDSDEGFGVMSMI